MRKRISADERREAGAVQRPELVFLCGMDSNPVKSAKNLQDWNPIPQKLKAS
jgi:hypothetical protein